MHRRRLIAITGVLAASARAAATPPLRAGWDDYPPYQMAGPDGQPGGLDMSLTRAVLHQAGLTTTWHRMPWARQMLSLQDGSLDLVMSASRVPEREPFALWTLPYRPENGALLARQRPATPPASLAALLGARVRIGMIRGTAYPGELQAVRQDPRFARLLMPLRHIEQGLRMLIDGRVDYLIDDPVTTNYLAAQLGLPAPVVVHWVHRGESHLMLSRATERQQPGLLARLDTAITQLRDSGELRRLSQAITGASD